MLYNIGKLKSYFNSNGTSKIRLKELGLAIQIMHVNDFEKYFLDIDLSARRRIDLFFSNP